MAQRQGRRTREETRLLLLETARAVMLAEGLPEGTNIKLTSVLEQAGLTTGAAYQVWKSQQVFQEDLALFVARQFEWAQPATDSKALIEELAASGDARVAIRGMALTHYDAFVNRPEFLMVLHYWGIQSPREELSDAIRAGYEIVHEGLVGACGRLLELHGLSCREPRSADDLAVAMLAAIEGLVLRRHFDSGRVESPGDRSNGGEELFAAMAEGIFDRFTTVGSST